MPLFGNKDKNVEPAPVTHSSGPRHSTTEKRGLFNRRRSSSSSDLDRRNNNNNNHLSKRSTGGGGGIFSRSNKHEDPSIVDARQRVSAAEQAEREADRALIQARQAVRDAREHVLALEREAKEDARLAKIKGDQAHAIGKSARGLGRHG